MKETGTGDPPLWKVKEKSVMRLLKIAYEKYPYAR